MTIENRLKIIEEKMNIMESILIEVAITMDKLETSPRIKKKIWNKLQELEYIQYEIMEKL